jgi:hypothetical protein
MAAVVMMMAAVVVVVIVISEAAAKNMISQVHVHLQYVFSYCCLFWKT